MPIPAATATCPRFDPGTVWSGTGTCRVWKKAAYVCGHVPACPRAALETSTPTINPMFQRIRNMHAALILHCLRSGRWIAPVDRMPKDSGPLETLPQSVLCLLPRMRQNVREDAAGEFVQQTARTKNDDGGRRTTIASNRAGGGGGGTSRSCGGGGGVELSWSFVSRQKLCVATVSMPPHPLGTFGSLAIAFLVKSPNFIPCSTSSSTCRK